MNQLLEKIREVRKENPDVRVYLGDSKNKEKFYEKFGFVKRTDADLGAGTILEESLLDINIQIYPMESADLVDNKKD